MDDIEQRLTALEALQEHPTIPGTSLSRGLAPISGIQWCLALGPLRLPKSFFYGSTIEEVVSLAEVAFGLKK